jgi:hypothetical protein
VALRVPGIVLQFELLPAMTEHPDWGAEITALLKRRLVEAHRHHGLRCALRVTPTDMRDMSKPPQLRAGAGCEWLMRSIEVCITAGADLVSVESVGGKDYDCRLMNAAAARGGAITLRDALTESDEWLSPQAAVLSPRATIAIASAIAAGENNYRRTVAAGLAAVSLLRCGFAEGRLSLSAKEIRWLDRIEAELRTLPASEAELLAEMEQTYAGTFDAASYGLSGKDGE